MLYLMYSETTMLRPKWERNQPHNQIHTSQINNNINDDDDNNKKSESLWRKRNKEEQLK